MPQPHLWQPERLHAVFFNSIRPAIKDFSHFQQWPTLDNLNHYNQVKPIYNAQQQALHCIADNGKSDLAYEHRIYLHAELPTRPQHWHDFLNYLVWQSFPRSKAALNHLQYREDSLKTTNVKQRSPLQNKMALFDECGMVVLSDRDDLLELIDNFAWHELFWQQRAALMQHMRFYIYGHGLLEKTLTPYIGITGMSILLSVNSDLIQAPSYHQCQEVDKMLEQYFYNNDCKIQAQRLSPLPLLGIPAWYPANQDECFYENTQYFRQGRSHTL